MTISRTTCIWALMLAMVVLAMPCQADVYINEFMASSSTNGRVDPDELGEYPDWIELYNDGGSPVDLSGWYMTDDLGVPNQFQITANTIPAGGFLVLYADNDPEQGTNHLDFKLSAGGEAVGLSSDGITFVDSKLFGEQTEDESYGRFFDGMTNWMIMTNATPGATNLAGYVGVVADTKFSVDRGYFTNTFPVTITSATAGAEIYFTTDFSEPSVTNGLLYTNAIIITNTTVLRAAAFKTAWKETDIDTHTYLYIGNVLHQTQDQYNFPTSWGYYIFEYLPLSISNGVHVPADYEMNPDVVTNVAYSGEITNAMTEFPSLCLNLPMENIFGLTNGYLTNAIYANSDEEGTNWERSASMEIINTNGGTELAVNCGIRMMGGHSIYPSATPKHSIGVRFKPEYGPSKMNYKMFKDSPVDEFNMIVLRGVFSDAWPDMPDAQYIVDRFAHQTQLDMGQPGSHNEWFHLYINGLYWGIYDATERPDADFAASYMGGDSDDYDAVKHGGPYELVDGDNVSWLNVRDMATAGLTDNADYALFADEVDVVNLADYILENAYFSNTDWPGKNWWANRGREPGGKWRFYCWDSEYMLRDVNANKLLDSNAAGTSYYLYQKARDNAEFQLLFADRAHKHMFNGGALTISNNIARYTALTDEIYGPIICESARWGDTDGTRNGAVNYTRDGNWKPAVATRTNTFFPDRHAVFFAQMKFINLYPQVVAPIFSIDGVEQFGGAIAEEARLTMNNTKSDPIYYTIDGTDPREWGTGYTNGNLYSGAVILERNSLVKSRAVSNHVWSALNEAVYTVSIPSPLRITEIMYNPSNPATGTAETNYTTSDFEFIELKNTSSYEIGLAGLEFVDGIRFDFTEGDVASLLGGEYVVLVRNYDAFTNRYTNASSMHIAGTYHGPLFDPVGSLSDAGENLRLIDGLGREIHNFDYEDDWHPYTDGEGYSLTIIDPQADASTWGSKASWRGSSLIYGSPGEADTAPPYAPGTILINEALTHQDKDDPGDWIELYNASTGTVVITDWYLSDSDNDLKKFKITTPTSLDPGDHVVFDEFSDFGTNVLGTNGFALSEHGDRIYLSSGDGASLAEPAYREYAEFDAAETDVTFGRYTKTDGSVDFTAMETPTTNLLNSRPLVGPIVINEIMYNPTNDQHEYIELINISDSTVQLYDPDNSSNAWKLDGVGFTFPTNIAMTNGEIALLVRDTILTNEFRASNSVPVNVNIYSYDGFLDNGGERLRLMKPGTPDETGVPYITVDMVNYKDEAPWPSAADGMGPAMMKLGPTLYGNDAYNWTTSAVSGTPGVGVIPATELIYISPTEINVTQSEDSYPTDQTFIVKNIGVSNLVYTIADNVSWLNVSPAGGSCDALTINEHTNIFLSPVTDLSAGTYSATVTVSSAGAPNSPVECVVNLIVAERDVVKPEILFVGSKITNQVSVIYSETVEAGVGVGGAELISNYSVNTGTIAVVDAALKSDNKTVLLTTASPFVTSVVYELVVSNVNDRASIPNMLTSPVTNTFQHDINNIPPTAVIVGSTSLVADVYGSVSLSGFSSIDGDTKLYGGSFGLKFKWTQVSGASGIIGNGDTSFGSFTPLGGGTSVIELLVFDGLDTDKAYLQVVTAGPYLDWLELHYPGKTAFKDILLGDTDGDGMITKDEYTAGTIPTNQNSVFRTLPLEPSGNGYKLTWLSVTNRTYEVLKSTNLTEAWITPSLTNSYPGELSGTNTFTDANASTNSRLFYLIRTE